MLTPEQIADGWIEHDGGKCPVPLPSRVTIMCRSGDIGTGEASICFWRWEEKPVDYDIIAYRPEPRHD